MGIPHDNWSIVWLHFTNKNRRQTFAFICPNMNQDKNQHVFFIENFNIWRLLLIIAFYHQTKTPISFWCRRGLKPKSLISETLTVELIRTHKTNTFWFGYNLWRVNGYEIKFPVAWSKQCLIWQAWVILYYSFYRFLVSTCKWIIRGSFFGVVKIYTPKPQLDLDNRLAKINCNSVLREAQFFIDFFASHSYAF